jgi:2-(1,2-epoxy-1,2-dihydrophenyl)acetyl-CoA isomerase
VLTRETIFSLSARYGGVDRLTGEVAMTEILYSEDGPLATITLNRPDALNAFNRAARIGFIEAMRRASESRDVRAVLLHGAGRGFSAGTDLTEALPPDGVETVLGKEYKTGILAVGFLPKPVIAAVHGFAAGIAVSYAVACDLVVMGDKSFMQVPFAKIGLIPDGGLCWQLAQRVGHRVAFEIAMEGERMPATRCRELGLVNRVVAENKVLEEAKAWAMRLAAQAPIAVAGTKRILRAAGTSSLEQIIDLETQCQQQCATSADFKEGVSAFFDKREPRFTGS